jgi:hypothetical protein
VKNNIASDLSVREYRLRHKKRPAWPLIQAEDILIVASAGKRECYDRDAIHDPLLPGNRSQTVIYGRICRYPGADEGLRSDPFSSFVQALGLRRPPSWDWVGKVVSNN